MNGLIVFSCFDYIGGCYNIKNETDSRCEAPAEKDSQFTHTQDEAQSTQVNGQLIYHHIYKLAMLPV